MKLEKISIVLIILLGIGVYINSLNSSFLWDDIYLIKDNTYIKSFANIDRFFTEDIEAGAGSKSCFYRPIQMFSYMLDYRLWKLDVRGYHFTNIILHILVALSFFRLVSMLFSNKLLSLLSSLLFLIHPIHTESVSYISGRADVLSTLFMLSSFVFYIRYIQLKKKIFYIIMVLSYILAVLSKENSLVFPALLLLYHYSFNKKIKIKQFLPILVIAAAYILLRLTVFKDLLPHLAHTTTWLQRIPGFFVAITSYIRLLFLPFGLHMEYGDKLFSINNPKAIIGIVLIIFLLTYAIRIRRRKKLVFFSISWFFLALLPSSNVYPIKSYMAEHWLYLPSFGFFLIIAGVLSSFYKREDLKKASICCMFVLIAFYSYLTIKQNTYWQQPIYFYERTLRYSPDSARVYNNLGFEYYKIDEKDKAMDLYQRAIELDPLLSRAYYNQGIAYYTKGKYPEAINSYKKALEIDPNYVEACNNLGIVYSRTGNAEEAISLYKKAIELNPNYARTYTNLGNTYGIMGKPQKSIAAFKKALEINPGYGLACYNLALTYFRQKQYIMAIQYCDKAVKLRHRIDPKFIKLLDPYRKKGLQ